MRRLVCAGSAALLITVFSAGQAQADPEPVDQVPEGASPMTDHLEVAVAEAQEALQQFLADFEEAISPITDAPDEGVGEAPDAESLLTQDYEGELARLSAFLDEVASQIDDWTEQALDELASAPDDLETALVQLSTYVDQVASQVEDWDEQIVEGLENALAQLSTYVDQWLASQDEWIQQFEHGLSPLTECYEWTPHAAESPLTPTVPRTLHVAVVLDGVSLERGMAVMNRAADPYAPLGITVATTFVVLDYPADGVSDDFPWMTPRPTADINEFLDDVKAFHNGVRPEGVDLVYAMSAKELYAEPTGDRTSRQYGVAGLADCIGGIHFDDRAFAVGEDLPDEAPYPGGFEPLTDAAAKVVAHEIGHLLGAHHQYANCAEGLPATAGEREVDACTLMINDVGLASLRFSSLNGAIVRGHLDH